jgi:hypothetical protein
VARPANGVRNQSVVDQGEKKALDCVWESVFTEPREKAVLLIASKELCRKVE